MNSQRVATGLRVAELAFAIMVMGISGDWLARNDWAFKRFIYTMTVSAVASLLAVLWLFPFSETFVHWPGDTFISILWWVAFGLLANVKSNPNFSDSFFFSFFLCHWLKRVEKYSLCPHVAVSSWPGSAASTRRWWPSASYLPLFGSHRRRRAFLRFAVPKIAPPGPRVVVAGFAAVKYKPKRRIRNNSGDSGVKMMMLG